LFLSRSHQHPAHAWPRHGGGGWTKEFAELAAHFPEQEGARAIISVEVSRISDSCGYAVPLLRYEGERNQLSAWARRLGPEGLKAYRRENNQRSIDHIPGLEERT
jgi:hypothetical protein